IRQGFPLHKGYGTEKYFRLSKNLAEDVRDRAAGGVCGGQKAHRAFNQQDFETFLNVSKSAQRGENTFLTRCARLRGAGLFRPSIVGFSVEVSGDLIGLDDIDKGVGVDLPHGAGDLFDLVAVDDRVDEIPLLAVVEPGAAEEGGAVVGGGL